jgi:hypothetical protein
MAGIGSLECLNPLLIRLRSFNPDATNWTRQIIGLFFTVQKGNKTEVFQFPGFISY